MRILHLLNFFSGSSHDALVQRQTLASVREAYSLAASTGVDVHYIFIGTSVDNEFTGSMLSEADFQCSHSFFEQLTPETPHLFLYGRNNPTLRDTFFSPKVKEYLTSLDETKQQPGPLVVISNTDICLRPHAYLSIALLYSRNPHVNFVVNRETIDGEFLQKPLSEAYGAHGSKHPGHDFFCLNLDSYRSMELLDKSHIIGFGFVMRPVLANLILSEAPFFELRYSRLTFHFGDDMPWKDPKWDAAIEHNRLGMIEILRRLLSRLDYAVPDEKMSQLKSYFPESIVGAGFYV
jgi:hypothetical protein